MTTWILNEHEPADGRRTIAASGELDLAVAGAFEDALMRAIEAGPPRVLLDLREVTFIDSTAIGALLRSAERARAAGGELELECAAGNVLRVLDVAAIGDLVTIHRPPPHPALSEIRPLPR